MLDDGRKPQRQLELALTPGERFARIRRAVFDPSESAATVRNVRRLLEKIEAFSHRGERMELDFLAEVLGVSRRTVQRIIADAEALGVLAVDRTPRQRGGQPANSYRVQWDALRGGPIKRLPASSKAPPGGLDPPDRRNDKMSPRGDKMTTRGDKMSPPLRNTSPFGGPKDLIDPSFSIGTPCAPSAALQTEEEDQRALVEELRALGVADAERPVREALGRGTSSAELRAIFAFFASKPGAWGVGALWTRVKASRPGEPAEAFWPPVDPQFARRAANVERTRREREREAEEAAYRAKREREDAAMAALEAEWGPTLDGLDPTALRELAEAALADVRNALWPFFARDGAKTPLVRERLLGTLSRQAEAHA